MSFEFDPNKKLYLPNKNLEHNPIDLSEVKRIAAKAARTNARQP